VQWCIAEGAPAEPGIYVSSATAHNAQEGRRRGH